MVQILSIIVLPTFPINCWEGVEISNWLCLCLFSLKFLLLLLCILKLVLPVLLGTNTFKIIVSPRGIHSNHSRMPLYLVIFFVLKSILLNFNIATPAFLGLVFAQYIFDQPVHAFIMCVSCKYIDRSCFTHFNNIWRWMEAFSLLTAVTNMDEFKPTILVFVFSWSHLLLFFSCLPCVWHVLGLHSSSSTDLLL